MMDLFLHYLLHSYVCHGVEIKNPYSIHLCVLVIFGRSKRNLTNLFFFRWFKFTLKPPNSMGHGNLLSAIWDTSHWNLFVKFGLKTA